MSYALDSGTASVDVRTQVPGGTVSVIGPAQIAIVDGGAYTAVARDAAGGGAPFGLTVIDELS